jgi:hypothetical protein
MRGTDKEDFDGYFEILETFEIFGKILFRWVASRTIKRAALPSLGQTPSEAASRGESMDRNGWGKTK